MEDSAQALKIAFAIFMFIIAISVTLAFLSMARSTADTVFFRSDRTNFQTLTRLREDAAGNPINYEIVGTDDLIATLFRYYKESLSVTIKNSSGTIISVFDTAIEVDCDWRGSNEKTIDRILGFINGERDRNGKIENNRFDPKFNYLDPNHYHDNKLYNVKAFGKMSLKDLCDGHGGLRNARFKKTIVETLYEGEFHTPENYGLTDDGTVIQITPGIRKVYITYQIIS